MDGLGNIELHFRTLWSQVLDVIHDGNFVTPNGADNIATSAY
jgi:hypothetical protein